jgi:ASCH domain
MLPAISSNALNLCVWDENMRKSPKTKNSSIKALTIRQPFPELILRRRKPFEIRSWKTNYRGPLLIHSAMRVKSEFAKKLGLNPERLTTGAFVGVAVLSDVRPYSRADSRLLHARRAGGGWYPYLFSWVLKKPLRITNPIKAKGKLRLFTVSASVARLVKPYVRMLQIGSKKEASRHWIEVIYMRTILRRCIWQV